MLRMEDKDISLCEIEIMVAKFLGNSPKSNGELVRDVYGHLYPEEEDNLLSRLLDKI